MLKILFIFFNKEKIKFDKKLIYIFYNSIIENYNRGLDYFNWSYDIYFELIDHYKPKKIIIPNMISFDWLLINFLAKKK